MKRDSRNPLTREEIKAVRIVMGFNRDLRKKLNGVKKDSIYYFIKNNRIGILGLDYAVVPDVIKEQEDYKVFDALIESATSQVINGH